MMKVDVGTLSLTKEHIGKAVKALKSNRLSYGPMTEEFERKFAEMHGNTYGVFTNSGTSALQATLHAMKILYKWKDRDEVIMPATTFVATHNVITQNKLRPVLVDVGWDYNLDPDLIEEKITEKTKAIIVVHLLGKPAKMRTIMRIARKHKLKVIEDSCETMGVEGVGRADVTCFSFYVAHLLVTGVGGMAITKKRKLAELIRSLIFHGRDTKYLQIDDDDKYNEDVIHSRFRFNHPGYSYRGTEVEAALGLVELKRLKSNIRKRQRNAKYLSEGLGLTDEQYRKNHAYMMYPFISPVRDSLMLYLEKKGITTRTIMPLINQPFIRKTISKSHYPLSSYLLENGMLLGCHQDLTKKELDYVIETIRRFFSEQNS